MWNLECAFNVNQQHVDCTMWNLEFAFNVHE